MKIIHIVCRFLPYLSGISNVALGRAMGLSRLGHKVKVITPRYNKSWPALERLDKLTIERLTPLLKYGNAAFLPHLLWQLKNFEIIHLHYPFFGAAEIVWLAKKLRFLSKAKLVIQYHHDVIFKLKTQNSKLKTKDLILLTIIKFHTKFIMPQVLKSADKVIVSSLDYARHSNIAQILEKYPDKFAEIPLGVDLNKLKISVKGGSASGGKNEKSVLGEVEGLKIKELKNGLGIRENDKVILFVGGLDRAHYFKGLDVLLKAFKQLLITNYLFKKSKRVGQGKSRPDQLISLSTYLLIIGEGDLKPYYQNLAHQFDIEDKVIFAGRVSDKDLPKYYYLADLVVLPSIDRSEAFGLVLLEALACSKPVIASNLSGVRSVVNGDDKAGLLIEPGNIDDLTYKIKYLLENNKKREEMGRFGRKKVEEKYNLEILDKKLENLYENLFNT